MFSTPPPDRLSCHPEGNCGKAIASASEQGSSTPLHAVSPIASLVARLSASPPPCCPECFPISLHYTTPATHTHPPSIRLLLLGLTVPQGRGHLRTKWRISRQLCAHTLWWPSIIHSPLPPSCPPHHLLHCGLFICPRCRRRYLLCQAHSIPVMPSFKPFLPSFPRTPPPVIFSHPSQRPVTHHQMLYPRPLLQRHDPDLIQSSCWNQTPPTLVANTMMTS